MLQQFAFHNVVIVLLLLQLQCCSCFVLQQQQQQRKQQQDQHHVVMYMNEESNNEVPKMHHNTNHIDRRNFLLEKIPSVTTTTSLMIGASTGGLVMPSSGRASTDSNVDMIDNKLKTFQIIPDKSKNLNPILKPIKYNSFIERVALSKNGGTVWLGEHHNSQADHSLQLEILQQIHSIRQKGNNLKQPIAIGLEQVQIQFQNVLNDYISGLITIQELRNNVQWEKRWVWSFDLYEPIFVMAKQYHISLIALNVNSEDLALVERNGLQGLPINRLREYVIDAPGFGSFIKRQQYMDYVDYVIQPSYEIHQDMGLLKYSIDGIKLDEEMSYRNFFSARILWDESMASNAYKWRLNNPGGLLIGLVGADHVKFFNGIPGRYSRYDEKIRGDCISVLLNPTLIDTRPYGTVDNTPMAMSSEYPEQITLQLRYRKEDGDKKMNDKQGDVSAYTTGGVLALADYLVIG